MRKQHDNGKPRKASVMQHEQHEKGISAEVEQITPEIARRYMALNENFRPLDSQRVLKYAREMQAGAWEVNGDAIRFDGDGSLVDGQHRLAAVIESGVTIYALVVMGITAASLSTIDRGKPRSISQWLSAKGIKNAKMAAAVSRYVLAHEKGMWGLKSWRTSDFTDSEVIEFAFENESRIQDAISLCHRKQLNLSRSHLASILMCGSNPGHATKNATATYFVEGLVSGAGLDEHEPVLHLRNLLLSPRATHAVGSNYMKRMLTTIAWNKTVLGEPTRSLRFTTVGPSKQKPPKTILRAEGNW